jgi:hypothetical protein
MIHTAPQDYVNGVAVAGVVPDVSGSSFTIHLTKAVKASLPIAWFIVDLAPESGPMAGATLPMVAKSVLSKAPPHGRPSSRPRLGSIAQPVRDPAGIMRTKPVT